MLRRAGRLRNPGCPYLAAPTVSTLAVFTQNGEEYRFVLGSRSKWKATIDQARQA